MPSDEHLGAIPFEVRAALAALKERLRARFAERFLEMRLFGSFARGEQHEESDVDVLLLFDQPLGAKDQEALFHEVAAVDIRHRLWISPLILSRDKLAQMLADELQLALDVEHEGLHV